MTLAGFDPDRAGDLDALLARVGPRFERAEPRRRAEVFVRGLLSGLARKNGWTLAEYAGDRNPSGMQRLLNAARWDAGGVRDDLRGWVVERLGDGVHGVLAVDEIRFAKSGRESVGVHRQYAPGSLRVGNAQIAVLMAYVTPRGRALVDRELYLPDEWILDTERARRAGVPPDLAFASKPDLAVRMIERAVNVHRDVAWVVADGIIGESAGLRAWLQERPLGYVLPARGDELVVTRDGAAGEAAAVSDTLAESAWTPIAAKPASRRAPVDWARIVLGGGELTGEGDPWDQSLLIGRSAGHPAQLDYYQCHAPAGTALASLVWVAGARGAVRECVEFANNNLGLDHYQVRRYEPWYRHVTLCMLAAAAVAVAHQLG